MKRIFYCERSGIQCDFSLERFDGSLELCIDIRPQGLTNVFRSAGYFTLAFVSRSACLRELIAIQGRWIAKRGRSLPGFCSGRELYLGSLKGIHRKRNRKIFGFSVRGGADDSLLTMRDLRGEGLVDLPAEALETAIELLRQEP